ncbi:MAG: hypothetical protein ACOYMN_18900, partial [Roseimicrobium sp.]
FTGPGTNYAETDVSGAFILTYKNTSSILLDFQADTSKDSPLPNHVFSAIDGDLSMIGDNLDGFTPPTNVPKPSGALLIGITGMLALLRNRRRR